MLKGLCRVFKTTAFKYCFWIIVSLASLLALIVLYFWMVQPLLCYLRYINPTEHNGIEYYTEGLYMEFEAGDRFHSVLSQIPEVSIGKATYFYHVDRKKQDNPIRGKKWDAFILDITLEEDSYMDYCNRILGSAESTFNLHGYTVCYVPEYKTASPEDGVFVGLNEEELTLRIMLIIDGDDEPYDSIMWKSYIDDLELLFLFEWEQ